MMPKTKLGRWAAILAALFVALFFVVLKWRLKIGDPRLVILGISMIMSGIAAFVAGIVSLVKFRDRSPIVILTVIIGSIAVLMVVMEVLEALIP